MFADPFSIDSITVDVLTAALTFVSVSVLIKFPKAPPEPLWEFVFVSVSLRLSSAGLWTFKYELSCGNSGVHSRLNRPVESPVENVEFFLV